MMEPKWFWILLALLFIQGWTETEGCLKQERVALLQLKHFFNSPRFLHDWMGSQCCQWEGVMCSNTSRRVIQLSLISTRGWQEDGYLNASLFLPFKELKNLYLMGNGIAGFVVNQGIANLSSALQKLELLDLSFNHLNDISNLSWLSEVSSLKSLNLSGNGFTGSNHSNGFKWMSRLSKLETLDLSLNHLKNNILLHVAALSCLKTLNLARNELEGSFTIKGSRRQVLMNLEELDLSDNFLQNSSFEFISRLSNLKSLSIQGNNLQGSIDIKELNKLTKLQKLDLSYNHIESLESFDDTERQLKLIYLEQLDLSCNLLNNSRLGVIISELSNLRSLSLGSIKPKGSINIKELGRLQKLKSLYLHGVFSDGTFSLLQVVQSFPSVKTFSLSDNYLNKTIYPQELNNISSSVQEIFLYESHLSNNILHSIGALIYLKRLILSDSGLIGPLPTKGWCDLWNLEELDLSHNALEGSIPSCFSNLTSLRSLDISQNRIEISSLFNAFANNSLLNYLFVDQNRLVTEPTFQAQSQTKNTKFQLKMLSMSSCITKGFPQELPNFLYYQYDLRYLDLSYNNFAGRNPSWLLDNNTRLQQFLMTGNSFKGSLQLPKHSNVDMFEVDMSGNKMQGQIPMNICSTFPHLKGFSLSKNAFQGNIPPCLGGMKSLSLLDLSCNNFSGGKIEEFAKSSSLSTLRLSSNNLSGKLPPAIFSSTTLNQLYLDGNNFDGEIPLIDISTDRYPVLSDLDLSNNHLSGKLPRWMWNVSNLQKLVLSNNHFTGLVPLELCNSASLAFLDLSQNNFSGSIPSCFSSLTIEHLYLSRNRLSGPLPHALYNSSSLVTLDLSQNNFTGKIPYWIGTLSTLSALLLKAN